MGVFVTAPRFGSEAHTFEANFLLIAPCNASFLTTGQSWSAPTSALSHATTPGDSPTPPHPTPRPASNGRPVHRAQGEPSRCSSGGQHLLRTSCSALTPCLGQGCAGWGRVRSMGQSPPQGAEPPRRRGGVGGGGRCRRPRPPPLPPLCLLPGCATGAGGPTEGNG